MGAYEIKHGDFRDPLTNAAEFTIARDASTALTLHYGSLQIPQCEQKLFSYRHGFHAGNHADVLKHCVLAAIFDHMTIKETGYWYVDTHAGAGLYDLRGDWANKRGEYETGIARVWQADRRPLLVQQYVDIIQDLNGSNELAIYPGSPWLALYFARTQDRLRLFEWLEAEAQTLTDNLSQQRRIPARSIKIEVNDGFTALKSVLPVPTRRAVTLIDPSYENKQDYRAVVQTIREAMARFPTGCYVVWYPKVSRVQLTQMLRQLEHLPNVQWLNVEMTVSCAPTDGYGLFGSGLWVINPPHTLKKQLDQAMPWLTKLLALDSTAKWHVRASDQTKTTKSHQIRS